MLRKLLDKSEIIVAIGVYDALTAKLVEKAGFKVGFVSGYGVSASLGMPDMGLMSVTELLTHVEKMVMSTSIPFIVDCDTGYGGLINTVRTLSDFQRIGAAGIEIEDQEMPKKCAWMTGKRVVPTEEMLAKIKTADKIRNELDKDFLIIARTDATESYGLDEAIRRSNAYAEAGADMVTTMGNLPMDEFKRYIGSVSAPVTLVAGTPGMPTNQFSVEELERMGVRMIVFSTSLIRIAARAVLGLLEGLKTKRHVRDFLDRMSTNPEFNEWMGVRRYYEIEKKYLLLGKDLKAQMISLMKPDMKLEEVIEVTKTVYGWTYDQVAAASYYHALCLQLGWSVPPWVRKFRTKARRQ